MVNLGVDCVLWKLLLPENVWKKFTYISVKGVVTENRLYDMELRDGGMRSPRFELGSHDEIPHKTRRSIMRLRSYHAMPDVIRGI